MADAPNLSELFSAGSNVQKQVESAQLVASNKDFSLKVNTAIRQLEEATILVSELGLFSRNETIEEVSTTNLKYLLLPALLGDLVSQLMSADRISSLQRAQVYIVDFLQRCKDYAITNEELPSLGQDEDNEAEKKLKDESSSRTQRSKAIEQLAAERREKIARLKFKKETEAKLRELDKVIQSCESSQQPDEETAREHILTLLKLWVYKALDNLHSVRQEIDMLKQMEQIKKDLPAGAVATPPERPSRPPVKPFVITKDMLKDKVFGAGYPSLPTMTVEEFYEQQYKNNPPPQGNIKDQTESREDDREETEEEEEERLKKAREFDDFKDVNRRGWGNRKNQG